METQNSNFFNTSRNENPNWEFAGKLKDVKVFNQNNKVFSWITTSTTFFVIEGFLKEVVHPGQAVKLSKRDNAAKIGQALVYRPEDENLILSKLS